MKIVLSNILVFGLCFSTPQWSYFGISLPKWCVFLGYYRHPLIIPSYFPKSFIHFFKPLDCPGLEKCSSVLKVIVCEDVPMSSGICEIIHMSSGICVSFCTPLFLGAFLTALSTFLLKFGVNSFHCISLAGFMLRLWLCFNSQVELAQVSCHSCWSTMAPPFRVNFSCISLAFYKVKVFCEKYCRWYFALFSMWIM